MDLPNVEEVKEEVKEQLVPAEETKQQLEKVADSLGLNVIRFWEKVMK